MRRVHLLIHVIVPVFLAMSVLFAALAPSQAQTAAQATPAATESATAGDDSNELPIYIDITGFVQEVTSTSVRIGDQVMLIPAGMTLPTGIEVGKAASVRGNLHDDDTITIIVIAPGYHLSTPTPMPTQAPSEIATPAATIEPPTAVVGCDKPGQKLELVLSAAYAIPYEQIVDLHCKGYSFGELARAYLILITGDDAGKSFTVVQILDLRHKGNGWRGIFTMLEVQPDSNLIIFVINGGRSTFFVDCGGKNNPKKSRYCSRSSQSDGSGKGGKGSGDDNDDD